MPALGWLPKRFESLKKSIKMAKQAPSEVPKIRDFEYERLENLKLALLHFFNAKMYLHGKALELYAQAYEQLRSISLKNEFKNVDQAVLRMVFASNPHISATPRGGGGWVSNRSSGNGSNRGPQSESPQRPPQASQAANPRPSSQPQQQQAPQQQRGKPQGAPTQARQPQGNAQRATSAG